MNKNLHKEQYLQQNIIMYCFFLAILSKKNLKTIIFATDKERLIVIQ